MKLCMLDLETLGNHNDAVILSVGAMCFDPMSRLEITEEDLRFNPEAIHWIIEVEDQVKRGRKIDYSTVKWWMEQDDKAKEIFNKELEAYTVADFALYFFDWYKNRKPDACYAYGSTFDHTILQNLYDNVGVKNPIHYRDQLDMRTLVRFSGIECPELPDWLVSHNALHDCVRQIIWMQEIWSRLLFG